MEELKQYLVVRHNEDKKVYEYMTASEIAKLLLEIVTSETVILRAENELDLMHERLDSAMHLIEIHADTKHSEDIPNKILQIADMYDIDIFRRENMEAVK